MRLGRNIVKKLLQSRVFLAFLLLATVLSFVRLSNELARRTKINNEIATLRAQTIQLKQEQIDLSSLIEYLNTDEYIEDAARKKLNYSKPGEQLIIVEDGNTEKTKDLTSRDSIQTNVQLWWDYFFNS